jgi:hypothetical protein
MSEIKSKKNTKVCSKCPGEKSLDCFDNKPDGRDGKNSICKECRKKTRKTVVKATAHTAVEYSVVSEINQLMREYADFLDGNDNPFGFEVAEMNLPINQIAHKPDGPKSFVDRLKVLTDYLVFESRSTPANSFLISGVKKSDESKIRLAVVQVVKSTIVADGDIDFVFYKGVPSAQKIVDVAGPSCRVVIRDYPGFPTNLTNAEKEEIIAKCK